MDAIQYKKSNLRRKIIDISGYGFTGKTIINDFLKNSDKVFSPPNSFEFELFRVHGGLLDLYFSIYESWSVVRSSKKINNFRNLIYRIGHKRSILKPNSYFASGHCYDDFFNQRFIPLSEKFLEEIVIQKRKKFWPYENLSNSKLELLVNKLKRVLLGMPPFQNVNYCDRNSFLKNVNNYIQELYNEVCNESHSHIILNNSFEPYNPLPCLEMIKNSKSIIVDRDPRDIYASLIDTNKSFLSSHENKKTIKYIKSTSNYDDINLFIKNYKILRENSAENNDKRILKVAFEDFVLQNKEISNRLSQFLEIETPAYLSNLQISNSKKNVGIWKQYSHRNEIKFIEKELKPFCYKN